MRTLFVIPHAHITDAPGARTHGSEGQDTPIRAAALLRCVSALHQTFGARQHLVGTRADPRSNASLAASVDVVLCTAGDQHLAHTLPPHLVRPHATSLHPRLLGFACQSILRGNAGRYDWFGYLEDDCEVTDALFFAKLAWFNIQFGAGALLQPNRYEVSAGPVVQKLYIDGRLAPSRAPFRDTPAPEQLQATLLGRAWRFRRVSNPHAGCFFADAAQMRRLAADPAFGQYSEAFVGPLESAATLPVLRNFAVYKPALENAAFLEIRHLHQRVLDERLSFTLGPGARSSAPSLKTGERRQAGRRDGSGGHVRDSVCQDREHGDHRHLVPSAGLQAVSAGRALQQEGGGEAVAVSGLQHGGQFCRVPHHVHAPGARQGAEPSLQPGQIGGRQAVDLLRQDGHHSTLPCAGWHRQQVAAYSGGG